MNHVLEHVASIEGNHWNQVGKSKQNVDPHHPKHQIDEDQQPSFPRKLPRNVSSACSIASSFGCIATPWNSNGMIMMVTTCSGAMSVLCRAVYSTFGERDPARRSMPAVFEESPSTPKNGSPCSIENDSNCSSEKPRF